MDIAIHLLCAALLLLFVVSCVLVSIVLKDHKRKDEIIINLPKHVGHGSHVSIVINGLKELDQHNWQD